MKGICCASICLSTIIAALSLSDSANARQPDENRLGREWSVTEAGSYTGRWVRRGNTEIWDGTWNNGAVAILTISISGNKVTINRKDVAGPSTGLTASYEGTLEVDGTMRGTQTVTWPGHFTNRTQQWQGRIVTGVQAPPASSLTGAWVHSADSSAQTPDSKVIVVQDGNLVTLTMAYKSEGTKDHWVTMICAGPLTNAEVRLRCNWAPGGNPLGFAGNALMVMRVSPDAGHMDGTLQTATGTQESHYSRIR